MFGRSLFILAAILACFGSPTTSAASVFYGVNVDSSGVHTAYVGTTAAPDLISVRFDEVSEIEVDSLILLFGYSAEELLLVPEEDAAAMVDVLQSFDGEITATLWEGDFPTFEGTLGQRAILGRLSSHVAFFRHKSTPVANGGWVANGCSMSPDFNFGGCCDDHDACYCAQSGKSGCDSALKSCIEDSGHEYLACLYYGGVRLFGGWFYGSVPPPPVGIDDFFPGAGVLVGSPMPNPSSGATRIRLGLRRPSSVTVKIYNLAGRLVRELPPGQRAAGEHLLLWDGRDTHGIPVVSGVYAIQVVVSGEAVLSKKVSILR